LLQIMEQKIVSNKKQKNTTALDVIYGTFRSGIEFVEPITSKRTLKWLNATDCNGPSVR